MRHQGSTDPLQGDDANWDDMFRAVRQGLGVLKCEGLDCVFIDDYRRQGKKALVIKEISSETDDSVQFAPDIEVVITRGIGSVMGEMEEISAHDNLPPFVAAMISMRMKAATKPMWMITANRMCSKCPEIHSASKYEEDLVEAATIAVMSAMQIILSAAMEDFQQLQKSSDTE